MIAESFERIHRSNLIGMGILPLGSRRSDAQNPGLTGDEQISVGGLQQLQPGQTVPVHITYADGRKEVIDTRCRIDTGNELTYYENDGILHYVIRKML